MSTPTLALLISAAGKSEVDALAASVKELQSSLTNLKNSASGGGFSNLDNLTKEIQGMRADLAVSLAGLRTELADGFAKMGKEVETGGSAAADAVNKVKVRLNAASVDLGDGIKASISASGVKAKDALIAMASQVAGGEDAVAAAMLSAQEKQAVLQAKEDELFETRIQRMKLTSAQWETARLEASAKEAAATAAAAAKEAAAAEAQIAAENEAFQTRIQRMKLTSAQWETARLEASAKEAAAATAAFDATLLAQLKGIAKEEDAWETRLLELKVNSAKMETARLEQIAKEAASAEAQVAAQILAAAKLEAAYNAGTERLKLARQVRARALLDQGVGGETVALSYGASATAAASEASSLSALQTALARTTTGHNNLTGAIQVNQRAMREAGTEVNELVQGRWNRAIGTLSSIANALGVFTFMLSGTGAIIGGFVALGAVIAAVTVHAENQQRALSNLQKELEGTGRGALFTRTELTELVKAVADLPGVSNSAAAGIVSDFAKAHNIGAPLMRDLALSVADYAAATGTKAPEAAKALAKMFEDPTTGAKEFDKALGALSANQAAQLVFAREHADLAGQQRIMLDALKESTHDLAHEGTELEQAETKVGVAWNHLADSWGKSTAIVTVITGITSLVTALGELMDKSTTYADFIDKHPVISRILMGGGPGTQVLQVASLLNQGFKNPVGGTTSFEDGFTPSSVLTSSNESQQGAKDNTFVKKVQDQNEKYRTANKDLDRMRGERADILKAIDLATSKNDTDSLKLLHEELNGVNAALAKKAQPEALKLYHDALKELNLELQKNATAEKFATDAENLSTAQLKMQYDVGALNFGEYQQKLTALQDNAYAARLQRALANQKLIDEDLAKATQRQSGLKNSAAPAERESAANDVQAIRQKQDEQRLTLQTLITKEQEKQYAIIVQQLAPVKTFLDGADAEYVKLKAGVDLDIQKLALKTNLNQLSERDQYVQEKVLASTEATTKEIAKAQALLTERIAPGGIWEMFGAGGPSTADLEDGSPAAISMRKLMDNIEKLKALLPDMKAELTDAFSADFDASKIQTMTKSLQTGLADAIMNAGHDGGKGLIKVLQDELLKKPFKIMLEGALQGISGGLSQAAYGLFSGGAGTGSIGAAINAGSLLSTGGSLYSVGSQVLGGSMSVANGAGTLYANATNSGIDGLLSTNGAYGTAAAGAATIGAGGEAAGYAGLSAADAAAMGGGASVAGGAAVGEGVGAAATGALAAIPVYGWVALAALALYSAFSSSGGGPKTEAGYAPNGLDISGIDIGGSRQGSQRGDVAAAQQISTGIASSYQSIADQLGLVKDKLDVGVFYAQDPQGTSQTQLQVVGGSYNRGTQNGGIENVDRGDQALKDAIALATAQLILSNLQSADIKGKVGEYIKAISPTGTADQINASLQLAANAQSMYVAFGKLGPQFAEVTDMSVLGINGLVTSLGGLTKAAQSLSDYYSNFYSDAEKRTNSINDITKTLNDAGLSVTAQQVGSATKAQFRQVVESLDLTTASGQKTFAALMSVSSAFSALTQDITAYTSNFLTAAEQRTSVVNQITKTLNDAGVMVTSSQVATATREQFRQLVESLQAMGAAGKAGVDALMSVAGAFASITDAATLTQTVLDKVNAARDVVISAYQTEISALKTFATDVQKFLTDLAAGSLSPLTPAQKYVATQNTFQTTLAAANSGDVTAQKDLTKAASDFLTASQAYNASSPQYQADYARVQQSLQSAITTATASSSTLDDQLKSLNVINTSVLSITDAIASLKDAIEAAIAAGQGGAIDPNLLKLTGVTSTTATSTTTGTTTTGSQPSVYTSPGGATYSNGAVTVLGGSQYTIPQIQDYINGLISNNDTLGAYNAFKTAGISLADADRVMSWSAGTAEQWAISQGLPVFARGINFVPNDTLAMLHAGERVLPAADNRVLMHKLNDSSDSSAVEGELRQLRKELLSAVQAMHADNNTGHAANAQETAKTAGTVSTAVVQAIVTQGASTKAKALAALK